MGGLREVFLRRKDRASRAGDGPVTGPHVARRRTSLRWLATTVVLLVLLAGWDDDAPQDYLDPAGPVAKEADQLFRMLLWLAVVLVLVEVLLVVR